MFTYFEKSKVLPVLPPLITELLLPSKSRLVADARALRTDGFRQRIYFTNQRVSQATARRVSNPKVQGTTCSSGDVSVCWTSEAREFILRSELCGQCTRIKSADERKRSCRRHGRRSKRQIKGHCSCGCRRNFSTPCGPVGVCLSV